MDIGNTLKRIRLIYGLTGRNLSEELGISASYLSEIENNKKKPSLELLEMYSSVFDIKLSSLMLLAENNEQIQSQGKGDVFIKKMMVKLIENMSKNLVDIDEKV